MARFGQSSLDAANAAANAALQGVLRPMTLCRCTAIVLDRHPLWLAAVEGVLTGLDVEVVGTATSPEAALELVEEHEPELFITEIDTSEGQIDGLTCLTQARQRSPKLSAIVLSRHTDAHSIESALAAGAAAYVTKTAHREDLALAVRQAFEHTIYLRGNGQSAPPAETPLLTQREVEVLRLVAEGMSNTRIARKLWVTEQTVKFHLSNIYRKLGVANRTEASRWAHGQGLLPSRVENI
jgi:DNA-binding NarL/FixJ family response regulator